MPEVAPSRISSPVQALYPFYNQGMPGYPFLQSKNVTRPISKLDRVKYERLRRLSRTPPAYAAVQRITNGVLAMPWRVEPPIELKTNNAALTLADNATRALKKPNSDLLGSYRKLISGIVDDLLTINYACIERHPGNEDRPFWLFAANSGVIRLNPDWNPQVEGLVPKFLDYGVKGKPVEIMSDQMFMLINNVNTHEAIPPGPLEIAYNYIEAWLGVSDFQQSTTGEATREFLLDLGDISSDEMKAFREYWNIEVIQNKQTAMVAGKGQVKVVKIGAASDDGLYHAYCEYLLRIIALSFSLSGRDVNITDHDNRATANVSADTTFSYAVKPIAETVFEGLDSEVVDYFMPGFRLKPSYKEPRSDAQRNEDVRADFEKGIITRNEARLERGYDPVNDGDVFSSSNAKTENGIVI